MFAKSPVFSVHGGNSLRMATRRKDSFSNGGQRSLKKDTSQPYVVKVEGSCIATRVRLSAQWTFDRILNKVFKTCI